MYLFLVSITGLVYCNLMRDNLKPWVDDLTEKMPGKGKAYRRRGLSRCCCRKIRTQEIWSGLEGPGRGLILD
jgi:hypothetical protein